MRYLGMLAICGVFIANHLLDLRPLLIKFDLCIVCVCVCVCVTK